MPTEFDRTLERAAEDFDDWRDEFDAPRMVKPRKNARNLTKPEIAARNICADTAEKLRALRSDSGRDDG